MKNKIRITILLLLFVLVAEKEIFSQIPPHFTKIFGDSALINHGNSVIQLPDGSIFFAGYATTQSGNTRDVTLTKLDKSGNVLWTNSYGTVQDDISARMVFNGDHSLAICGQTVDTFTYETSALLLSIDTSGTLEWMKTYASTGLTESFSGLTRAIDGGWIASGFQSDSTSSGNNFILIKTDSQGNLQWSENFGDANNNEVSDAVFQMSNGDIIISGDKQVAPEKYNAWMIKTDSSGNYLWDLLSRNNHNGGCKNIFVDDENNILIIGEAASDSSNQFDIQLTKSGQDGNLIWQKYIPASNLGDAGFSIQQDTPANYMLTGYYYDTTSALTKIVMMRIDTAGNEINKKLYGTGLENIGYDLQHSFYGGYLIAGSDFEYSKYVLIFDDVPGATAIAENETTSAEFFPYPNPACSGQSLFFNKNLVMPAITVHDVTGRIVFSETSSGSLNQFFLPSQMQQGIYLVTFSSEHKFYHAFLLIQ